MSMLSRTAMVIALVLAFLVGRFTANDTNPNPQVSINEPADGSSSAAELWTHFIDNIESGGLAVLADYPQQHSIDQAEGLRYMMRQLSSTIDLVMKRQTDQVPLLHLVSSPIKKWGMDGADGKYTSAAIESDGSYLFYGSLGNAQLFAIQLANQLGDYNAFGELTAERIKMDENGNFEVLISRQKPADWNGNWLEMHPQATDVLVREYFHDWNTEKPGSYWLVRTDEVPAGEPLNLDKTASIMNDVSSLFRLRLPQWMGRTEQVRRQLVNKVHTQKGSRGSLAANYYGSGWFKVGEEEALLIELSPPEAIMWSVQLGNVWWESIDFLNHTASYNDQQALASSDGKYRFVLSLQDPGVANWLNPVGHPEGMMFFRFQQADALPDVDVKLVPFDTLGEHLPGDVTAMTATARQAEIDARRQHAVIRWAP